MYARFSDAAGTGAGLYRPARFGATRFGYHGPKLLCWVAGTARHRAFDRDGWSVSLRRGEEASTLTIELFGFTPVHGQEIVLAAGGPNHRLFRGTIVRVRQVRGRLHEGRVIWHCTALDWTYQLHAARVIKRYTNQSATAIAEDLLATYAPDFTADIEPDLAVLESFQATAQTLPTTFRQLAERVGGYFFTDFDKVVHLYTTKAGWSPAALTAANRHVRAFSYETDIEDLRNRIYVEGVGASVTAPVAAGSTTLPVDDGSIWATSGTNYAKLEGQRVTYTGVEGTSGAGSVVAGRATSTPSAPSAADALVAGSLVGRYRYKTAFVIGGGESAPSSASSEVSVGVADPVGTNVQLQTATGGFITPGTVVRYKFTFVTARGETTAGPATGTFTVTADGGVGIGSTPTPAIGIPLGPTGTTARKIYRSDNNGEYGLVQTISDNTTTAAVDGNNVLGVAPPAANTAGGSRVAVTAIATGPAGTTARRLYRTVAGGSEYKHLTTIADNSTTTFDDNVSDLRLGDTAPEGSTVPTAAGDTSLPVTELSSFPASGWVRAAEQILRYTGRSASSGAGTLTGIPASGAGAVTAEIRAGATVVVAPHLTGLPASGDGALAHNARVGEPVHVLPVSADGTSEGSFGTRERIEQQRGLSRAEALARAAAILALLKDPRVTGWATSTDPRLRPGRPWVVNITEWDLDVTVTIQGVEIRPSDDGWPHPIRTAQFSSRTLDDLYAELRAIKESRLSI